MEKSTAFEQSTFGLLPEPKNRFGSFGVSLVVNGLIGAAILILTMAKVHEAHIKQRQMELTYLAEPKPVVPPPPPKVKMPPIPKLDVTPKITPPPVAKPVIEPPKVEMKVEAPAPAMPAPAPRPVVKPAAPVVGLLRDASPAPNAAPKPAATAKAAGFGDPAGVQPNPNAKSAATVAAVGGFGNTATTATGGSPNRGVVTNTGFGSGLGAGSPNSSPHGVVAGAGFGSGVAQSGTPGGHGTVAATGGFGNNVAAAGSGPVARVQAPATTSIVVTQKPLPQYTAEAREAHIQGEVTLEVKFGANGEVQVLRVVNGLGHGLDEQARLAAERIQFKPATRDGKPVDQVTIVRIPFQLA